MRSSSPRYARTRHEFLRLFEGGDRYRSKVSRRSSVVIGESGVARRGQLFTRETLLPSQYFTGTLTAGDPADLEILRSLGPVRVGGRRTTHGLADAAINGPGGPAGPNSSGK